MFELQNLLQVNLPFDLIETYGRRLLDWGASPEIGLSARVLDGTPHREYEKWADMLAESRVTLHGPFMDLSPGGIEPLVVEATRRRFAQAAGLAGLFRAEAINFHGGYDFTRYPHDTRRWIGTAAETFGQVLEATEAAGTLVLLENVYDYDPAVMAELIGRIDHPRLGFCLDTGHFNVWSRVPLKEWLERLGPRLRRLHLHDNDGSFDLHLPIGRGGFDFRALFTWLKKEGLRPGLTLEPHSEKHLRQTFTALKKLLAETDFRPPD